MATTTAPISAQERAVSLNVLVRQQRSLWGDAWWRLTRNKAAMLGLVLIGLFCLMAIFAPALAPYDPVDQLTDNGKRAPTLREPAVLCPAPPSFCWVREQYIDARYPLGTDNIGRDILSRLIFSSRISMVVGFIPVSLIFAIGVSLGMIAGYVGGWVDNLLMRFTDFIYAFPDLLFLVLIMATLRNTPFGDIMGGLVLLFVSLAIVSWVGMARLMRGQVLSLKEKEFVEAARAVGVGPARIMLRHLFPNALAPLIVAVAFAVPGAILTEAALGYLGIGIKPPTPTWGVMINDGFTYFSATPWATLFPALCIAVVLLSFTFVGDGLRDALDPRMKT